MRLLLENVGAFGSGEVEIRPGLNALLGANGAGKSTIVNAFYLALTGESLESTNVNSLIRWGYPTMTVRLVSEDWEVTRTVSQKGVKHYLKDSDNNIFAKKDEVNAFVMHRFQIEDVAAFRAVFFAEQFKSIDVINETNAARASMLLDVFGFRKFEKLRTVLQSMLNGMTVTTVGDDLLEMLKTQSQTARQTLREAVAAQNASYMSHLSESEAAELADHVARAKLPDDISKAETELVDVEQNLTTTDEEIELLNKTATQLDHTGAQNKRLFDNTSEALVLAKQRLGILRESKQPKPNSVLKTMKDYQRQQAEIDTELRSLQERKTLIQDGVCPLTKGAMCADLKVLTNPEVIEKDVAELKSKRKGLTHDLAELEKMLEESQKFYAEYQEVKARVKELEGKLEPLKPFADFDLESYKKATEEAQTTSEKLKGLYEGKAALTQRKSELETFITSAYMFESKEDLEQAREKLQRHQEAVVLYRERSAAVEKARQDAVTAQQAYEQAVADRKAAEELMKKRTLLQTTRESIHRDNVPKLLLEGIRTELNAQLSHFTDLFEFPYNVHLGEDGSFQFDSVTGGYVDACRLSGGQKFLLSLIHRCALAEMLNTAFPVLVLDEPTTGLDVQNRELLANMLRNVSVILGQRGMSLVVPTHDKLLAASADNTIEI